MVNYLSRSCINTNNALTCWRSTSIMVASLVQYEVRTSIDVIDRQRVNLGYLNPKATASQYIVRVILLMLYDLKIKPVVSVLRFKRYI